MSNLEKDPIQQKSIEIVMEAARRFTFLDSHAGHPFTKKTRAALAFLSNEEVDMEQVKADLDIDDSLHPMPIYEVDK